MEIKGLVLEKPRDACQNTKIESEGVHFFFCPLAQVISILLEYQGADWLTVLQLPTGSVHTEGGGRAGRTGETKAGITACQPRDSDIP